MLALLTLLDAVSFEINRRGITRRAFLASVGITEARFNAVVGRRAELTVEEKRKLMEVIPVKEWELFGPGPSRRSRAGVGLQMREDTALATGR